jgi:Uma2 family endonuclease
MSTAVISPNVEAALHLIDTMDYGECQVLHNVSWDEYEELLTELGPGYAVRIAYTEGELELMAPLYRHERPKDLVLLMVSVLTQELGWEMESAGSTTLKRKDMKRGAEPDTCFYIQNAAQIIGRDSIDLRFDPPPDIVFEVDVTSKSKSKQTTYAKFGVPELWRYDSSGFHLFSLSGGRYVERDASVTFPFVRGRDLEEFIERGKMTGQNATLAAFREWVQAKLKDEAN